MTTPLEWTAVTVGTCSRRTAGRDGFKFIIDSVDGRAHALVARRGLTAGNHVTGSVIDAKAWCEAWGQPAPSPEFDPWVRQSGAHVRIFEHINHHGWQLRRRRMGWVLYRLMRDDTWYQGAIVGNNEKAAKARAAHIVEKTESGNA